MDFGLLILNEPGSPSTDWFVTLTVVLYGPESFPGPVEFNVFLILNNTFSQELRNLVGASNTVTTGQVVQFYGSNILRGLTRGTRLSLILNNGSGSEAVSIRMFASYMTAQQLK